jgi:adenine phosphoribosyltransferase
MSPLYADPAIFSNLIEDIISPFRRSKIDKIVALDATGFIIGSAASFKLQKGLILIRKGGEIPIHSDRKVITNFIDYTGKEKSLEIDISMITKDENYLIIDDWVGTGTQVKATINMIEKLGGNVIGISSIGSDRNEKTEILFQRYNLSSIGVNV